MKKRVTIGILALSVMMLWPQGPWQLLVFTPAMADDDDGDDGGGASGSGTASTGGNADSGTARPTSRKFKKLSNPKRATRAIQRKPIAKRLTKKPRKQVRQKKVIRSPSGLAFAAPDELVIRKLDPQNLAVLARNGFEKITAFTDRDGTVNAKFRIPASTKLLSARDQARQLLPSSQVDLNHYFRQGYKVQSEETCKGSTCAPFEMVGWKASLVTCRNIPEIGMIDTWVDPNHLALTNAKVTQIEVEGLAPNQKGSGHGTAIAALLAGSSAGPVPGLLPQAEIAAANVFEVSASGDERTDAYLLSSALHAFQQRGTKIVNMSLAGPPNDVLAEAIKTYTGQGMVILAASGNAGPAAGPAFPAAYDDVIAVTAVSASLKVYRRAGRGDHIDIAAPGVQIKTAGRNNNVEIFTGSSFAVPFVTAAVAAHMASGQKIVATNIVDVLKRNAKDLGEPGLDPIFGAGLLQFLGTCPN